MLNDAGSFASIVGLPLTFFGLIFAIYHLVKLRGETRAAKAAAEEARTLFKRDLANTDVATLRERIQRLVELLRMGNRQQVLNRFPDVWEVFIRLRRRHPSLSTEHRRQIQSAIETITNMQSQVEELERDVIPHDVVASFITELLKFQSALLSDLEDELEKSNVES